MTGERLPIEVWIVMNESGEYVVAGDEQAVTDLANDEFGEDAEVRYVTLNIKMFPPSRAAEVVQTVEFNLD